MRALVVSSVCFSREGIARALREDGFDATTLDHGSPEVARAAATTNVALVDLVDAQLDATLAAIDGHAPVVGLALSADPPVAAAAALGVRAFVGSDQTLATLVLTARKAARGEAVCPDSIAQVVFQSLGTPRPTTGALLTDRLTRREQEICRLVVRGLTNREIATALVIEPSTVKNHVHQILRKLDVRRRGQAAALLRELWTERSMRGDPAVRSAWNP